MAMTLVDYTDFSGGVNQRIGPIVLDTQGDGAKFCDECLNMQPTQTGILKDAGLLAVLSAAISGTPKIQGMFSYNGGLLVAAGGYVYTVSGTTATQISGITLDATARVTGVAWAAKLIIMDGVGGGYSWDGTTATALTMTDPDGIWGSAKPLGAVVLRQRIYYWDATKIYTPAPNTYLNFTKTAGADAFICEFGYGGNIVGLMGLQNNKIIVYKEKLIRALAGTSQVGSGGDEFRFEFVSDEVGCVAPGTICMAGTDQFFMSNRGLRKLSLTTQYGVIEVQQPHYVLQDTIKTLNYGSAMASAAAVYYPALDTVYVSVPEGSGTTNTLTLAHNVTTGANHLRSGFVADALYVLNNTLYSGCNGQIYKHGNADNYAGTVISAYWKSKWIAHGSLSAHKQYRQLTFYAEGTGVGTFVVRWRVLRPDETVSQQQTEIVNTGSLWGEMIWGVDLWGGGGQAVLPIKDLGRGKAIKIEILNATPNSTVQIRQISLEYRPISTVRG